MSRRDIINFKPTTLANRGQEEIDRPSRQEAEDAVRTLIRWVGGSPEREEFTKEALEW